MIGAQEIFVGHVKRKSSECFVPDVTVRLKLRANHQPSLRFPYKVPIAMQSALKDKLDEFITAGYIEPAMDNLEYLSPVVIVKKEKGI